MAPRCVDTLHQHAKKNRALTSRRWRCCSCEAAPRPHDTHASVLSHTTRCIHTVTTSLQGQWGCSEFRPCIHAQPGEGLLARLGLPEGAVRNVLMAGDIVPRAFACDYTLVADILKRVSPSFREHRCLSGGERVVSWIWQKLCSCIVSLAPPSCCCVEESASCEYMCFSYYCARAICHQLLPIRQPNCLRSCV